MQDEVLKGGMEQSEQSRKGRQESNDSGEKQRRDWDIGPRGTIWKKGSRQGKERWVKLIAKRTDF